MNNFIENYPIIFVVLISLLAWVVFFSGFFTAYLLYTICG